MTIRDSAGSLLQSHRARITAPDRRNFLPKNHRLAARPLSPDDAPQLQSAVPNFRTAFPFFRMALPNCWTTFPFFRETFPNSRAISPFYWTTSPNFSTAFPIGNGLFPKHLWRFLELFKKIAYWDSGLRFDDPNLYWGDPSYILEPGDPGYVPPSPPTPTPNKTMKTHTPHCPVPVIVYNGNLIVAAAQKYPTVIARLSTDYLTETTTALGKLPTDVAGQKDARGETGNLTAAQQQNLVTLLYWMSQARKTAKLAFFGQDVKLHEEFLVAVHEDHNLPAVLGRADILLASVQKADNLAALKLKGWTEADTQAFVTVRGTFPQSTVVQQSSLSEAKKKTVVKSSDAADAYEHVLTVQHAGDLEYPATDPANAPIRAEFRLGIFPPDHHAPPAAPAPTPPPSGSK
jgi:hypothetical protein